MLSTLSHETGSKAVEMKLFPEGNIFSEQRETNTN